jgi:hypothetical protein
VVELVDTSDSKSDEPYKLMRVQVPPPVLTITATIAVIPAIFSTISVNYLLNLYIMGEIVTAALNPRIDYQTVLTLIVVYFLAVWLMFCFWVFLDAHKRYQKLTIAVMMTLFVLPFNLPGLVLYLIIRPEEDWNTLEIVDSGSHPVKGGVHVPLVHFVDEEGEVKLALNLSIAKGTNIDPDMNVNVTWDSQQPGMRELQAEDETAQLEDVSTSDDPLKNKLDSLKRRFRQSANSLRRSMTHSLNKYQPEKEGTYEAATETKKEQKSKKK